jgi:hypothetical protein
LKVLTEKFYREKVNGGSIMKKITVCLLLIVFSCQLFGQEYNINNLFQITIPAEIDVASINQYLRIKSDNSQYCVVNNMYVIWQNRYFLINVNCYGNSNKNVFNGTETYNMRKGVYYAKYNIADQVTYLKKNYVERPFTNKNKVKLSRFVSDWASGMTSDYYGLYFMLPGTEFTECIISINNIWGTFSKNYKLAFDDVTYSRKYMLEGGMLEKFFQLLNLLEESITFDISSNSTSIVNGYAYEKYNTDYSYVIPTTSNLRMRNSPSLTGEVIGYMADSLYQIIVFGEASEVDNIKGNWILLKPYNGNSLAWVFNGYTRKATEEEIEGYFTGS